MGRNAYEEGGKETPNSSPWSAVEVKGDYVFLSYFMYL